MQEEYLVQGRRLGESDLNEIRRLIGINPAWSRRCLSLELAQMWNWRTSAGRLKDMAARSLLVKLERRGLLILPPRRRSPPRRSPPSTLMLDKDPAGAPIAQPLEGLRPLQWNTVLPGSAGHAAFSRYLAHHHYLGFQGPVGENVAYMVSDRYGRDLACLLFGASAWKTKPRDSWIGWNDATRARRLSLLANNSRFLILPWVRVPHLASHLLACALRRVSADWQARYGHPLLLVETFVERDRFRGTCYRAANWIRVGQTQGRTRQDRDRNIRAPIKDIYLYPLTTHFREDLCRVDG